MIDQIIWTDGLPSLEGRRLIRSKCGGFLHMVNEELPRGSKVSTNYLVEIPRLFGDYFTRTGEQDSDPRSIQRMFGLCAFELLHTHGGNLRPILERHGFDVDTNPRGILGAVALTVAMFERGDSVESSVSLSQEVVVVLPQSDVSITLARTESAASAAEPITGGEEKADAKAGCLPGNPTGAVPEDFFPEEGRDYKKHKRLAMHAMNI